MLAGFSPNLHAFRPKPAASDAPYSVARSGETEPLSLRLNGLADDVGHGTCPTYRHVDIASRRSGSLRKAPVPPHE